MRKRLYPWIVALVLALALVAVCSPAPATRLNTYRAGYVMAYQEAEAARAADPTLTRGRYAIEKREALKKQGHVPMSFYRGLKDGFRDAIRGRQPRFTIEDVLLDRLPAYLRPKP